MPNLIHKMISYRSERRLWTFLSKPIRTPHESKWILSRCEGCPQLRRGKCNLCGCPVSEGSPKTTWATTQCPLPSPRWGPSAELKSIVAKLRVLRTFHDEELVHESTKAAERYDRRRNRECGGCR